MKMMEAFGEDIMGKESAHRDTGQKGKDDKIGLIGGTRDN